MAILKIEINQMADPKFQINVVGGEGHEDTSILTVWVTDNQTGQKGIIRFTPDQYENFVCQANEVLSVHKTAVRKMRHG